MTVVTPELFDALPKGMALCPSPAGQEPGDHPMSRVMEETELVNLVIYPCFGERTLDVFKVSATSAYWTKIWRRKIG